jgi:cytoskeletal protein CcmA (bactofilin family)
MFTSTGTEGAKPTAQKPLGAKEPGLSIIASGLRIEGELDTNGVVKVEGTVIGRVRAERQVLIAKGGLVDGDIMTREAIIGGEVKGAVYADERVEVQANSAVNGDIVTQRLVVQEGGEVNGTVKMSNPNALAKTDGGKPRKGETQRPITSERSLTPAPAQAL